MHLVQNSRPPERVVSSLEPAAPEEAPSEESPYALTGAGLFSGNSRWIFYGMMGGGLLICVGGFVFSHNKELSSKSSAGARRLIGVFTHSISSSPNGTAPPAPVVIQIQPEMLRVTAISLGHPRLAVINGSALAEGDFFLVHTSGNGVVVRLKVMKIADGIVDLQNGTQRICARLMVTEQKKGSTALKKSTPIAASR